MQNSLPTGLAALGMVNALGSDLTTIWERLSAGDTDQMQPYDGPLPIQAPIVGRVREKLPEIPGPFVDFDCRNNALLLAAYKQIESDVAEQIARVGKGRIGIVLGSSTSGVQATEGALQHWQAHQSLPATYSYSQHEMGSVSSFLSAYTGITGPAYTISTACSSSAKVFGAGRQLLDLGLCDCCDRWRS